MEPMTAQPEYLQAASVKTLQYILKRKENRGVSIDVSGNVLWPDNPKFDPDNCRWFFRGEAVNELLRRFAALEAERDKWKAFADPDALTVAYMLGRETITQSPKEPTDGKDE